jgi:arsenate reductase (glutaredoxin)
VRIAEELGVDVDVVVYQKTPPDRATLESIVKKLQDPVTDLVRRDSQFQKLGLSDADVASAKQVVDILLKHKMLLQRPVVVTDSVAIIGRPKERVRELLS